ncbi:MAG: DNA-protecting protein DprA [Proteobacteria bacterium]|nr:DNA-protecting protein DprA [Pseudomonadota bacterium]
MTQLLLQNNGASLRSVSPYLEMGAYEVLWAQEGATFKTIADRFRKEPDALPSDLVPGTEAEKMAAWVLDHLRGLGVARFGVCVHRAGEYPQKLRDARHPVELLYYRGIWNLVEAPSVAVVGTRKPSAEGIRRTRQLVRGLVQAGYTVVSGLAEGIDTTAHGKALELGAPTLAVIGTPLGKAFPASNRELQARLARDHLVISQVPVYRYEQQQISQNRLFFPERNVTMAALTQATVIVEAGETSGTLVQARAALHQGRKLFIMESAFQRQDLTWPPRFEARGAIRFRSTEQLIEALRDDG